MTDETDNTPGEQNRDIDPKQPSLLRNYISFIGIAIAAASLTSIALLALIELSSGSENTYTVLVT